MRTAAGAFATELLAAAASPAEAQGFQVIDLVSDGFVPAATVDPLLVNA